MTAIASVRLRPYRLRLRAPHVDAHGGFATRHGVILELIDSKGRVGLGDCAPLPPFTPALEACRSALGREAARLPGKNPEEAWSAAAAGAFAALPGPARSAFETALGFLVAQERAEPLSALLGGDPGNRPARLAVNALVDRDDVAAACDQAAWFAAAGYTVFKVKVGLGEDRDASLVRSLRQQLGPDASLRVDANGAWSPEAFERLAPLLRAGHVELVEQPLPPGAVDELDLLRRLRETLGLRIALDESLADPERAIRLIEGGACDAIVVKPSLLGLVAAAGLATASRARGLDVIMTGAFESGAGLAAAMEFAAAFGAPGVAHGFATALAVLDDPVTGVPQPAGGFVALPPGGVHPQLAPTVAAAEATP
jgi:o-succinylbenzoate synthase